MSQVIIINDDKRYAQFIKKSISNLSQTGIFVSSSAVDAISHLEKVDDVQLIISKYNIKRERSFKILEKYLLEKNRIINLIVLEESPLELPSYANQISDYADPNKVIRACIREMGLGLTTDKSIALVGFKQIKVEFLKHIKVAPCDIFVRILKEKSEDQYLKRVHKGDVIDSDLINKYSRESIHYLFVSATHHELLIKCVYAQFSKILSRNTIGIERRISVTEQSYEFCRVQLAENGFNTENVSLTNSIMTSIKKSIMQVSDKNEVIDLIKIIIKNTTSFRYKQLHLLSLFSTTMIRNSKWGSRDQIEKLIYVSFFHDISLQEDDQVKINELEALNNSEFSKTETETILNHAYLSSEIIKVLPNVPIGVEQIIRQHHGKENGIGFSTTININKISRLTIVFIIAEQFVNSFLTNIETGKKVNVGTIIKELRKKHLSQTIQKTIDSLQKSFQ